MDHLREAKENFTSLTSFFESTGACAKYVREELLNMLSSLKEASNVEGTISLILSGAEDLDYSLPTLGLKPFLQFERNLLCIADGILAQTNLREFEKAVALESIRQHALLPLIRQSAVLQQTFNTNEKSPSLVKHTPRGY